MTAGNSEHSPQTDPFIIRGHHLRTYEFMTSRGWTAEQLAHCGRGESGEIDPRLPNQSYNQDFWGTDAATADEVERRKTAVLRAFQDLDDDAPVKIVADQKDGICNGCAVGLHCSLRAPRAVDVAEGDVAHIKSFRRIAQTLEIPADAIREGREMSTYSDAAPRMSPVLHTTAGVVRQVAGQNAFVEDEPTPELVIDALNLVDNLTPRIFKYKHPTRMDKWLSLRYIIGAAFIPSTLMFMFYAGGTVEAKNNVEISAQPSITATARVGELRQKAQLSLGGLVLTGGTYMGMELSYGRRKKLKEYADKPV